MKIKGFIGISLSDWDGKVSAVVFLPTCNMRCPFCYNKALVLEPEKLPTIAFGQIEGHLKANRKWLDGVVITGGEPTLHKGLPSFCRKIQKVGFEVKLDTNGTNPEMIRRLIGEHLIDFVALDIKAPLHTRKYSRASGVNAEQLLSNIKETIRTLMNGKIAYEFRTTVVPTFHCAKDIEAICGSIKGCMKYALQNFKSEVETIDSRCQQLKPFSQGKMKALQRTAKKTVPNTVVRG